MVVTEEHDWTAFPELTNAQLEELRLQSPHEQIENDFEAVVVKVHDGDTVTLSTDFRDFEFPLRFASVDAPELSTGTPGEEARDYLSGLVLNERVLVLVDKKNRVEKYGRLLGDLVINGLNVGELMVNGGFSFPFERRREGEIPDLNKTLAENQWF